MNENNITRFEVSNFKKFDHLVVENIGQVNLITGDNNVGKTTLLEALLLEPKMKSNISLLSKVLATRNFKFDNQKKHDINDIEENQKVNIIGLFQKNVDSPMTVKYTKDEKIDEYVIYNCILDAVKTSDLTIKDFINEIKQYPEINLYSKNWLLFYFNDTLEYMVDLTSKYYHGFFSYEKYDSLISLRDFYENDLMDFFEIIASDSNKKKDFIDFINSIFLPKKITDIARRKHIGFFRLMMTTEDNISFHPITNYGDGFLRIFRICLEILMNDHKREDRKEKRVMNERLLIDEVEVGVHYLKMKDEWKAIFELSKQTGIQIFATTHSSDCIKAFAEAAEETEGWGDKIRLIELKEANVNGKDKMYATAYNLDNINAGLESGISMRGGRIYGKY